jgi:competence protein ComEC
MHGEDDDWAPATDARASERRTAPRPPNDAEQGPRRPIAGLARVKLAERLSLTCGLTAGWIAACYRAEIEAGNTFVWAVAALAAGAALYLALPHEPSIVALTMAAGVAAGLLLLRHRVGGTFPVTLAAMAAIGLWAAALEAHLVATPRLDHDRTVTVTGWVLDAETVLNGATRMTIGVVGMTGYRLPVEAIPTRISVTFRKGSPSFSVGDGIRFLARLRPLPGPVMPGGYDFARRAYFEGRGGTGYALGHIEHVDPGARPWAVWFAAGISGLRYTIAERIRSALPGAEGAIAAAIIVGETRAIPDAENDALRMSGLPHMITIAGLHMSIVASSVFFGVRFLLSLVPAIALRWPTKRIAAAASLVAITFYVLMAGPHISAERAYVMAAIMLMATILGRPALTMRNLALSAIILIAVNPAQVVEPGFQMSFLAVAALIAAYQALTRYRLARGARGDTHAATKAFLSMSFEAASAT